MTPDEIKALLLEDLEFKKHYEAVYHIQCYGCGDYFEDNGDFIYMGDKRKLCLECQQAVSNYLEAL